MNTSLNSHSIFCYGDSLVYGFAGVAKGRYSPKQRFTGIMQDLLGPGYDILEDGLRSRTTDLDDPKLTGRNGLTAFYGNVAAQLPFDLLIILLGTNDCKPHLNRDPAQVGPALQKYFEALKYNVDLFKLDMPKVLLVSPPFIEPAGYDQAMGSLFDEQSGQKSHQLAAVIKDVAAKNNAAFLDAAQVVGAGKMDGIHLDLEQNKLLAEALTAEVKKILA